jgi:hypothetical protein
MDFHHLIGQHESKLCGFYIYIVPIQPPRHVFIEPKTRVRKIWKGVCPSIATAILNSRRDDRENRKVAPNRLVQRRTDYNPQVGRILPRPRSDLLKRRKLGLVPLPLDERIPVLEWNDRQSPFNWPLSGLAKDLTLGSFVTLPVISVVSRTAIT